MRTTATIVLALLGTSAALGAPPSISRMSHHGAKRGAALRLEIVGSGLAGARIETGLDASFTELGATKGDAMAKADGAKERLEYLVEVSYGARPGLYPLRLVSEAGVSNAQIFAVGLLDEIDEADGEPGAVQPIVSPILVNGRLYGPERDTYSIVQDEGESVVVEIEARRLGSAIDPAFEILDSRGEVLVHIDDSPGIGVDCRTVFTAPADGTYRLVVRDSKYSYQTADFYRLKVASFDFAESVFPLGGRRGDQVEVEWVGGNLTAVDIGTVDLAGVGGALTLAARDGHTLPIPFVVGDLPEATEKEGHQIQAIAADSLMNGHIGARGEIDRYRLAVDPGEVWLFEAQAGGLGTSRLSAVLTLYDSEGSRLASAGDEEPDQGSFRLLAPTRTTGDPHLLFEVPEGVTEIHAHIEDLALRGGPLYGYRLTARRSDPDFRLSLGTSFLNLSAGSTEIVRVAVDRRGYLGPIRLTIPQPPPGVTVRGGSVPREVGLDNGDSRTVARSGALSLTANDDAPATIADIEVWGEATLPDGTVLRRKARTPGMITRVRQEDGQMGTTGGEKAFTAPWLGLGFPAAVTPAGTEALHSTAPAKIRLVKGTPFDLPWAWDGGTQMLKAPRVVTIEPIGPSQLRPKRVDEEDHYSNEGTVHVRTSDGTAHDTFDVIPAAIFDGGRRIYGPITTFQVVPGYEVSLTAEAHITAGRSGRIEGSIRRDPTFAQPVTVRADGLPPEIECRAREVAAVDTEFSITCRAEAAVEPGEYPYELISNSWMPGEKERAEYFVDPVPGVLIVALAEERVATRSSE